MSPRAAEEDIFCRKSNPFPYSSRCSDWVGGTDRPWGTSSGPRPLRPHVSFQIPRAPPHLSSIPRSVAALQNRRNLYDSLDGGLARR